MACSTCVISGSLSGACEKMNVGGNLDLWLTNACNWDEMTKTYWDDTDPDKFGALKDLTVAAYKGFLKIPTVANTISFTQATTGLGTTGGAFYTQTLTFNIGQYSQRVINFINDLLNSDGVVAIIRTRQPDEFSPNEGQLILIGQVSKLEARDGLNAGTGTVAADGSGFRTITLVTETVNPAIRILPDPTVYTSSSPNAEFMASVEVTTLTP